MGIAYGNERNDSSCQRRCSNHYSILSIYLLPWPLGLCPILLVVVIALTGVNNASAHKIPCRPGSGFKLAFSEAPQNLTINIGSAHSTPPIIVGARFGNTSEWITLNLTAGANAIPLVSVGLLDPERANYPHVLDIVTQFEGGNARLELESIQIDAVSALLLIHPTKSPDKSAWAGRKAREVRSEETGVRVHR
jgi:hypothetical protein